MQTAEQLYPDLTPEERLRFLEDNAHHVEEGSYYHTLTEEEKAQKRETITGNLMKTFELEEELTGIKATYKKQIDPLKEETRNLVGHVKTGQEERKGVLYHIPDYNAGMMYIYDASGIAQGSRRLKPEERQATLSIMR